MSRNKLILAIDDEPMALGFLEELLVEARDSIDRIQRILRPDLPAGDSP